MREKEHCRRLLCTLSSRTIREPNPRERERDRTVAGHKWLASVGARAFGWAFLRAFGWAFRGAFGWAFRAAAGALGPDLVQEGRNLHGEPLGPQAQLNERVGFQQPAVR